MSAQILSKWKAVLMGIAVLAGLYLTSLYSYLLFHVAVEIFSIIIACGIFVIMWNARRYFDNGYLLFLGIAFLFVGITDLVHTLAYKGMGVFPEYDANLAPQLWIFARYLESVSLLLAPSFLSRKFRAEPVLAIYAGVSAFFMFLIFSGLFPACFVEGEGLTPFKKLSEYLISAIIGLAMLRLYSKRESFDPGVLKLLTGALVLTIFSELAFTAYVSVYGPANMVGHYFKLAAFTLVYKAMIQTGLQKPYTLLFRDLKIREGELEREIAVRREAEREKEALIKKLQAALDNIKTLKGLLPMCAWCKKVRDDRGYWEKVEAYIEKHSEATFTHGICPECLQKISPEFFEGKKEKPKKET